MPETPQPPQNAQPSPGSRTPDEPPKTAGSAEAPAGDAAAAVNADAVAPGPASTGAGSAAPDDGGLDDGVPDDHAPAADADAAGAGEDTTPAADAALVADPTPRTNNTPVANGVVNTAADDLVAPDDPADADGPAAPDDLAGADEVAAAVLAAAGRATLPFQAARRDRSYATAFWYNDLVESTPGHEVVRQYLITSEARTRYELGQWSLREGLAEPRLPADELVMPSFARKWTRLGDLGVAVMPTVDLHLHAEKGGWRWTTDEVTAGLAAQPADIALIGAEPLPAYVLGHEVEGDADGRHYERPQRLLPGAVLRTGDDPAAPVRFTAALPDGFEGAPVFAALPMDDERLKLVCLGLALPAPDDEDRQPGTIVITFDLLRPAVHAVTPRRDRRWWQRP